MPLDLDKGACVLSAAIPDSSPANYTRSVALTGMHWTDPSGAQWFALAFLSPAEAESGQTGVLGGSTDIHIGGSGGGNAIEVNLQYVFSDYISAAKGAALAVSNATYASGPNLVTITTTAPHGLSGNPYVTIAGATPAGYNGLWYATVTGASTLTYIPATGLTTPATGTITCQPVIMVAKPWKLRCSRTAETGADGTVWHMSYAAAAAAAYDGTIPPSGAATTGNCVRTKLGYSGAGSGVTETESVAPEWEVADILYALPAATTMVDANGHPIIYILTGLGGVNWTAISF
jgi:hypothetical protein